jgi:hypothetical protein
MVVSWCGSGEVSAARRGGAPARVCERRGRGRPSRVARARCLPSFPWVGMGSKGWWPNNREGCYRARCVVCQIQSSRAGCCFLPGQPAIPRKRERGAFLVFLCEGGGGSCGVVVLGLCLCCATPNLVVVAVSKDRFASGFRFFFRNGVGSGAIDQDPKGGGCDESERKKKRGGGGGVQEWRGGGGRARRACRGATSQSEGGRLKGSRVCLCVCRPSCVVARGANAAAARTHASTHTNHTRARTLGALGREGDGGEEGVVVVVCAPAPQKRRGGEALAIQYGRNR